MNLPGFSITTLLLPRADEKPKYSAEDLLRYWDAPASAPGWRFHSVSEPGKPSSSASSGSGAAAAPLAVKSGSAPLPHADFAAFDKAVKSACEAVVKAEPEITRFDTIAGDGDAGLTLKAGAQGKLC